MTESYGNAAAAVQQALRNVEQIENPDVTINRLRQEIAAQDGYWAEKEKEYAHSQGAGSHARWEAGQIRHLLQALVLPRLESLDKLSPVGKATQLNLLVPFDSPGGLREFLLHFFQLVPAGAMGEMEFQERDAFEREVYILYDLYKVKKTLEVIDTLLNAIHDPAKRFPSQFPAASQEQILKSLKGVLNLLFTQCLPPKHRHELITSLSPEYLSRESVTRRREAGLLYTYPHVLSKYDYRRFFFLIYFKTGMKAKMGDQEREFRFNFLQFQMLKKEYLVFWLASSLKNHPDKFKHYSRYMLRGKTLLAHIVENPAKEGELLMELPTPTFNDLVAEVNEEVAPDKKVAFEPESERVGPYAKLRNQLTNAVQVARETLSAIKGPAEPLVAPAPVPPPAASSTPKPQPGEPVWQVTLLKPEQISNPFLHTQAAQYGALLNLFKARMAGNFADYSAYVTKMLESTPESVTIRRRTPKHEWTLPYLLVKETLEKKVYYLLVLGAEVKAKQLGMGFSASGAYQFIPYFVFASSEGETSWGQPLGDRHAAGQTLREYSFQNPAVISQALALLERVKTKNQR